MAAFAQFRLTKQGLVSYKIGSNGSSTWQDMSMGKRINVGDVEIVVTEKRRRHNIKVYDIGGVNPIRKGNLSVGITKAGRSAIQRSHS